LREVVSASDKHLSEACGFSFRLSVIEIDFLSCVEEIHEFDDCAEVTPLWIASSDLSGSLE
jgi:hypothetical protein